jgi:photosystem II stability/assembly factor-like uncharacterized protein
MWAAGQDGLMVSAFDGVTVVERPSLAGASLRAMVCVDDQLAWAVGDGGRIVATRDGGSTWSPEAAPVTGTLWGVSFVDAGRGYAVGDGGAVLRTIDAGATWTRLPVWIDGNGAAAISGSLRGVAAAASGGLVLVVGEGGVVLRSSDGGERFDRVGTPATATLNAVRLAEDEVHAVAVGDGGAVIASEDGGLTWRAEAGAPFDLRGLALNDPSATAVGAGGFIWRRPDSTRSWSAIPSGTTVDLAAVKFDRGSRSFGWVVGASGTVLYTTDGGAHFRPLVSGLRGALATIEDF